MENNINNLISEELKKVSFLFNYNTKRTLTENIVEQQKFNFNPNPEITQNTGGIKYTPKTPEELLKMSQTTTTTPTSVLITKNDNSYEYKMENGKYYFKGKPGGKFATKYPNWTEAKAQKGIDSIKALFDKNPKGDTPVEPVAKQPDTAQTETKPTDNSEKYKEFFAQKQKDFQNLPKTVVGTQGKETPKQPNDGIIDDSTPATKTPVQGQIQSTISDDEEV